MATLLASFWLPLWLLGCGLNNGNSFFRYRALLANCCSSEFKKKPKGNQTGSQKEARLYVYFYT